jgi:uncharacterized SAM-binding protein YcdF (DUF218 family)
VVEDGPGPADAIVVLAGDPGFERTTFAVSLLRAKQGRLLVVTGDDSGPGDSVSSLREAAIASGVPSQCIRTGRISHSTREELATLAPLLRDEGVRSVILVTSPYHQRRAFLTARKALAGIDVRNRPAVPSAWAPGRWWRDWRSRRIVVTEYAKLLYYLIRGWL